MKARGFLVTPKQEQPCHCERSPRSNLLKAKTFVIRRLLTCPGGRCQGKPHGARVVALVSAMPSRPAAPRNDTILFFFAPHHIHDRDRSDLHDGIDIVTRLQHMNRRTHTEQDRPNRFGFA